MRRSIVLALGLLIVLLTALSAQANLAIAGAPVSPEQPAPTTVPETRYGPSSASSAAPLDLSPYAATMDGYKADVHAAAAGSDTWNGPVGLDYRWSANVRIDDDTGGGQNSPSLANHNDTLYAAWRDDRYPQGIYFASSTNKGSSWSANSVVVTSTTGNSQFAQPTLTVGNDGAVYAAWWEQDNNVWQADVRFSKSTNGGVSWTDAVTVTDVSSMNYQDTSSLVVDASGHLYMAWTDYRNGDADIYFASSTDGGATWSPNTRISDDTTFYQQSMPSLAMDAAGTLYAAWKDDRSPQGLYFSSSSDGGSSWSANQRIGDDNNYVYGEYPSLVAEGSGQLYVVWNFNQDIYFISSTDGGATWNAEVRVDDANSYEQTLPSLATGSNGALYVAWQDRRNNNYDIYFSSSSDDGVTWSPNVRINDNIGFSDQFVPSLTVDDNGYPYVAWADNRNGGNSDIYMAGRGGPYYEPKRGYTASPVDAGDIVAWDSLAYTVSQPAGTAITVSVRVGNSPSPDAHWGAWVPLSGSPAALAALPPSRYLQWRAELSTTMSDTTPALNEVRVDWDSSAYTTVGGTIAAHTTWTAAASPYLVTSNIVVAQGITLTVEPGAEVWFQGNRSMLVNGGLLARGTTANPIAFTSWHVQGQPDDWLSILFGDSSVDASFDANGAYTGGSILQHVVVEYAGGGDNTSGAVQTNWAAPLIEQITARYNGANGIYSREGYGMRVISSTIQANQGGIHSAGGDAILIAGNTVDGNSGTGIFVADAYGYYGEPGAIIRDNTVSGNGSSGGSGIDIGYSGDVDIDHNTVVSNMGGGIKNSSASSMIRNNTVMSNTYSGSYYGGAGGGIYNEWGNVTVSGNIIQYNSAEVGGGFYGRDATLRGNVIRHNTASIGGGVTWLGSGSILYNVITDNTDNDTSDGNNAGGIWVNGGPPTIHYNDLTGNGGYALYNNINIVDVERLDARNNWWGSTDTGAIDALIYDYVDNGNKGFVDYLPALAGAGANLSSSTKTVTPLQAAPGDPVTYTITLSNTAPGTAAAAVILTDTLPLSVTFTPGSLSGGASYVTATRTIIWQGALVPGASKVFSFSAVLDAATTVGNLPITNIATIGGDTFQGEVNASAVFTPTLPGDCNGDGTVNVADITACGLEIFDGDGVDWQAVPGGSFPGNPLGCDANRDTRVDVGDVTCKVLIIFNGPGSCGAPILASTSAAAASLSIPEGLTATVGSQVEVPIMLATDGNAVAAAGFVLAYDPSWLHLNAVDGNGDGIPDAVRLNLPQGMVSQVSVDEANGRLTVFLADLSLPLATFSDGPLATATLDVLAQPDNASGQAALRFVEQSASLGSVNGTSVPVMTVDGGVAIEGAEGSPALQHEIYLPLMSQ